MELLKSMEKCILVHNTWSFITDIINIISLLFVVYLATIFVTLCSQLRAACRPGNNKSQCMMKKVAVASIETHSHLHQPRYPRLYNDLIRIGRSGDRITLQTRFFPHIHTYSGAHVASCARGTGSLSQW